MTNNKCVMCGEQYEGYGNNALPIIKGQCCDNCNHDVILARIDNWKEATK